MVGGKRQLAGEQRCKIGLEAALGPERNYCLCTPTVTRYVPLVVFVVVRRAISDERDLEMEEEEVVVGEEPLGANSVVVDSGGQQVTRAVSRCHTPLGINNNNFVAHLLFRMQ